MGHTTGFAHTEMTTAAELKYHSVPRAQTEKFLKEGPQIPEFPSWGLFSLWFWLPVHGSNLQARSFFSFVLGFLLKQS